MQESCTVPSITPRLVRLARLMPLKIVQSKRQCVIEVSHSRMEKRKEFSRCSHFLREVFLELGQSSI